MSGDNLNMCGIAVLFFGFIVGMGYADTDLKAYYSIAIMIIGAGIASIGCWKKYSKKGVTNDF